ncbi:MAG TPA: tetratricopeptide repeat protein [Phycisphaerae bacterium]|nr:tetratricopeptide repeat protein [Phycisphaerae bacterium]
MDQYTAYVIIAVIAAGVIVFLGIRYRKRLIIRFRRDKTEVEIDATASEIAQPPTLPPERPSPTASALHQLPSAPRDFVGRGNELDDLRREILKRGAIISCRGMGGVGKTALALVLAHEIKDHYPDAQIFFNLRGTDPQPLTAADAMAHVVRSFHPEARLPEDEAGLSTLYCSVLEGKRVLLLMDNAAGRGQVAPLVPPETCLLLVTTRHHFALEGLYSKDLDILSLEDARKLLLKICLRIGDAADRIATLCGRLPLALRAAASLLAATPNLKPQDYVARLEDERTRLESLGTEGVDIGVEASFGLSFNALEERAKRVFLRLSVFPASFDAQAEETIAQDPGHGRLTDLVRRSLVEYDSTKDRYRLHDLVRVFAAGHLEDADRAAAEAHHAEHYKDVLAVAKDQYKQGHGKELEGLALFDGERENIEAGWQWAKSHAGADEAAARLCSAYPDAGVYVLTLRQHPHERIAWIESALAAARSLKDRAAEGRHLGNMGNAYTDLGETRRAIEHYEKHLEIAREIGDRRGEGADLGNLGNAYAVLGETCRAIEYYEKQLAITREIGDRHGKGNALGNLGIAYSGLGETRRAIEHYEKHLEIAREIGDRRGEGSTLYNMANEYAKMGDCKKAIPMAEGALAIFEQIEDPHAGQVRRQLAEWKKKPE